MNEGATDRTILDSIRLESYGSQGSWDKRSISMMGCGSILSEWSSDFPGEYADSSDNAMEEVDPIKGFDW